MRHLYQFDPVTRIYVGCPSVWPLDPVTGRLAALADPPTSTPDDPGDIHAGKLARRLSDNSAWEQIDDNSGVWHGADGAAVTITDPTADVPGLTRTAPPDETYTLTDGVWVVDPAKEAAQLASIQLGAITGIDRDVDAIYAKVVGNRMEEYAAANEAAAAYRAAGYTGTVPLSVQAWVDAKNDPECDARWAADDILATAAAWEAAREQIRAARLAHKEQARQAVDQVALEAVQASWVAARSAIRAALGLED